MELHKRWLQLRTVPAARMTMPDGSAIPAEVRILVSMASLTGSQALTALRQKIHASRSRRATLVLTCDRQCMEGAVCHRQHFLEPGCAMLQEMTECSACDEVDTFFGARMMACDLAVDDVEKVWAHRRVLRVSAQSLFTCSCRSALFTARPTKQYRGLWGSGAVFSFVNRP